MLQDWRKRLADQDAMADRLREELEARRTRYEQADCEFNKLSELAHEIGLNHADGACALRKASQQFNCALHEYRLAVVRFSDFILREKPPEKAITAVGGGLREIGE